MALCDNVQGAYIREHDPKAVIAVFRDGPTRARSFTLTPADLHAYSASQGLTAAPRTQVTFPLHTKEHVHTLSVWICFVCVKKMLTDKFSTVAIRATQDISLATIGDGATSSSACGFPAPLR